MEDDILLMRRYNDIPQRASAGIHTHRYHVVATNYLVIHWCEWCSDIYILDSVGQNWDKKLRKVERE